MDQALHTFLLGFPALFSIVNPISGALIFREVTLGRTHREAGRLARKVGLYSFVVMVTALWAGSYVLAFFGVTLAALRIAGGLVVGISAWGLLTRPEAQEARKQQQAAPAGATSEDVAFYPLTIPFTTGPGTISVAVALGAGWQHLGPGAAGWFFLGMTAAALAMSATIVLTFSFAERLGDYLSPTSSRILTRLFAFLLLCIGVQILISGIEDVLGPLLAARR